VLLTAGFCGNQQTAGEKGREGLLQGQGLVWPPNINPIEASSRNSCVLVERNGSQTKFSRIDK
jgi:hypothetical protein